MIRVFRSALSPRWCKSVPEAKIYLHNEVGRVKIERLTHSPFCVGDICIFVINVALRGLSSNVSLWVWWYWIFFFEDCIWLYGWPIVGFCIICIVDFRLMIWKWYVYLRRVLGIIGLRIKECWFRIVIQSCVKWIYTSFNCFDASSNNYICK